jgi:hypothetical protein
MGLCRPTDLLTHERLPLLRMRLLLRVVHTATTMFMVNPSSFIAYLGDGTVLYLILVITSLLVRVGIVHHHL